MALLRVSAIDLTKPGYRGGTRAVSHGVVTFKKMQIPKFEVPKMKKRGRNAR